MCNTQARWGPELAIDKHRAASLPPSPPCLHPGIHQAEGGAGGWSVGSEPAATRCASIFIRGESLGSSWMLSTLLGKVSGPAAPFVASHWKEGILECQPERWYPDFEVFANFCGVKTPTEADFMLPK